MILENFKLDSQNHHKMSKNQTESHQNESINTFKSLFLKNVWGQKNHPESVETIFESIKKFQQVSEKFLEVIKFTRSELIDELLT